MQLRWRVGQGLNFDVRNDGGDRESSEICRVVLVAGPSLFRLELTHRDNHEPSVGGKYPADLANVLALCQRKH